MIAAWFRNILGARCVACRTPLPIGQKEVLCDACKIEWEAEKRALCTQCRLPQANCRCRPPILGDNVTIAFHLASYDKREASVCRKMVLHAKQRLDDALCHFLASELRRLLPTEIPCPCICYVPRSPHSVKHYGYDQAKRIAKALSVQTSFPLCRALKHKREAVGAQKGKNLDSRMISAHTTYTATEKISFVKGKTVLLLDDVMTSGASLHACAELLCANGAKQIWTLTVGSVSKSRENK